jgi:hypothetical protein
MSVAELETPVARGFLRPEKKKTKKNREKKMEKMSIPRGEFGK